MMLRTHLAITVLAILLFLPNVSNKLIFIIVALIATLIPDIDTGFSTIGRLKASRIIQFFAKHRSFFHSFSFCIAAGLVLAFFMPVLTLPFFIGYSLHLFADSFTVEGIRTFWPLKKVSSWKLRTGSYTETSLFIFFLLADVFVLIILASKIF